ncbi:MAG TPA: hypothetical protein ENI19_02010 [Candidatus Nealsonbacteria bacterium]|uniref:Uncharacterized protein n=1 Tax=marine sediment metagenome TaxID=412755 RepID=A0A0F9UF59_9ZZZZ|nr:hypothetical protein [Candidatus Nealsonbacteria bacterium]HEB46465.1 hypothetical protein [Candidatus Nealsonbacteria bacterium]
MNKNISDNLKYFSEAPKGVKFWEGKKYEFNLALSVIIELQGEKCVQKIEKRQDEIINQLKNTKIIDNPYSIKKSGLYKYPPKNLHFTLINFLKCKFDNKDKLTEFKNLLKYTNYEEIQENIIGIIKHKQIRRIKTDLRWIYSGDNEGIDSFSLQAFPHPVLIKKLNEINKEAEKKTYEFPCNAVGIKAYPKDTKSAFTMNILRFMRKDKSSESIEYAIKDDGKKAIDIVKTINIKDNRKPLKSLTIKKLCLVESDPFLREHEIIKTFNLINKFYKN